MKTVRKALVLAACAIMLVCATIAGTLAYLTANDSVTNHFTIGNVSITMDEAKVNEDGVAQPSEARVETNDYKLLPGKTYDKDPIIHVDTTSEDCWLFVTVDNQISSVAVPSSDTKSIEKQMETNGWMPLVIGGEPVENTYVYGYTAVSVDDLKDTNSDPKDKEVPVFTKFTVRSDAKASDLNTVNGNEIIVTAYAVQGAELTTVDAAWDAVKPAA